MAFTYEIYQRGQVEDAEALEFVLRLLDELKTEVSFVDSNGRELLGDKALVFAEDPNFNLGSQLSKYNTLISVGRDYGNLDEEIKGNTRSSTLQNFVLAFNIYIRTVANVESAQASIIQIQNIIENGLCRNYNNGANYTQDLASADGFTGKRYSTSLCHNRVAGGAGNKTFVLEPYSENNFYTSVVTFIMYISATNI